MLSEHKKRVGNWWRRQTPRTRRFIKVGCVVGGAPIVVYVGSGASEGCARSGVAFAAMIYTGLKYFGRVNKY